ncbi:MAG TPA: efflux RND transporter periplasmic adaptor subunit [Chitinophagaceae bacterium]
MNSYYYTRFLIFFLAVTASGSCDTSKKEDHAQHQQKEVYTCPMHPEIIRNAPGSCPVCGMDLVKQEMEVKPVETIGLETLLKPTNAIVISSVPVTTIEEREEKVALNVVGTVAYDTRRAGVISSRVNGRIEKLYIRYKFQPVTKGQRIMNIYSPDLMTAQQNLLFLLRNDPDNATMISAARERLILSGMSSSQVAEVIKTRTPRFSVAIFSNYSGFVTDLNETKMSSTPEIMQLPSSGQDLLVKEGMYVKNGQAIFSVYDPGRAWILLDIFPEQQGLVEVGNSVIVVPETAPQQKVRGKIDYIEPIFRSGSKTVTARLYFNNASLKLPIGSRVTADILASSKKAAWLPKGAVISLGMDKIVFIKEAGGFRAHKVNTGMNLNDYVQVSGGLTSTDSVALNAQYLVDNESFIKVAKQ